MTKILGHYLKRLIILMMIIAPPPLPPMCPPLICESDRVYSLEFCSYYNAKQDGLNDFSKKRSKNYDDLGKLRH